MTDMKQRSAFAHPPPSSPPLTPLSDWKAQLSNHSVVLGLSVYSWLDLRQPIHAKRFARFPQNAPLSRENRSPCLERPFFAKYFWLSLQILSQMLCSYDLSTWVLLLWRTGLVGILSRGVACGVMQMPFEAQHHPKPPQHLVAKYLRIQHVHPCTWTSATLVAQVTSVKRVRYPCVCTSAHNNIDDVHDHIHRQVTSTVILTSYNNDDEGKEDRRDIPSEHPGTEKSQERTHIFHMVSRAPGSNHRRQRHLSLSVYLFETWTFNILDGHIASSATT